MASLKISTLVAAAVVAFGVLGPNTSRADETGLAGMHKWVKVGKKTCFEGHEHYGSSAGMRDKKSATAEAIKSWSGFTAFEYGTTWANFNKAHKKRISCTQGSGGWGCEIEAIPCK